MQLEQEERGKEENGSLGADANLIELFQLKRGSNVDLFYAKVMELPSNCFDVSQWGVNFSACHSFPIFLCLMQDHK